MATQNLQTYSVTTFFADDAHWERVRPFIESTDKKLPSKRVFEYFVTSYARNHRCEYVKPNGQVFNIYRSIQTSLIGHSKHRMDPFKRGDGFMFRGVNTNTAQLTFFWWALINGVLDFVMDNLDKITAEMRSRTLPTAPSTQTVVVPMPRELFAQDTTAGERRRTLETVTSRLQKPRRKRRRIAKECAPMPARQTISNNPVRFDGALL